MFVPEIVMRENEYSSLPRELKCSSPSENGQFCLQFPWFTPLKPAQFAVNCATNAAEGKEQIKTNWQRHITDKYDMAAQLTVSSSVHLQHIPPHMEHPECSWLSGHHDLKGNFPN